MGGSDLEGDGGKTGFLLEVTCELSPELNDRPWMGRTLGRVLHNV